MASDIPTREEAEKIINDTKVINASVSWKLFNDTSWRLNQKVFSLDNNLIFSLRGQVGKTNYSFSLLFKNYAIRKYTKHAKHVYKSIEVTQPHKHIWDEKSFDKEVYIPSDINPKDNINDQFIAFCKECNIELRGGYQIAIFETKP